VGNGQDGAEAFEIDVGRADVVVRGHHEPSDLVEGGLDGLASDVEEDMLGLVGAGVDEVEDGALGFANDRCVRIGDEVANSGRVPMIAAGEAIALVHALLHDCPLTGFVDDERVEVELKAIGDGVVVDAGGEAAGAGEILAVEAGTGGELNQLVGRAAGVAAAASADGEAQLREAGIEAALECAKDGRGDAGGVPIHAHDRAEGLKPEGITETGEEFGGTVGVNDTLGDGCAKEGHALGKPGGNTPAMKGEVGGSRALHILILSQKKATRRRATELKTRSPGCAGSGLPRRIWWM